MMHFVNDEGKPVEFLQIRETVIVKTNGTRIRLKLNPKITISTSSLDKETNHQQWFGKNAGSLVADLERFADDLNRFCEDATAPDWKGRDLKPAIKVQAELRVGIRTDMREDTISGEEITPENIVTVTASLITNLRKDRKIEL